MDNLFFIIFGAISLGFLYIIMKYLKRKNSEIIKIRDIEMVVFKRHKNIDKTGFDNHKVTLVSIENENKIAYLNTKRAYYRYSVGENVIMQEVIYKYKDEFYSDIVFAKKSDYQRAESFKKQHSKDAELLDDNYIENCINEYHYEQKRSSNLLIIVFSLIFIFNVLFFLS